MVIVGKLDEHISSLYVFTHSFDKSESNESLRKVSIENFLFWFAHKYIDIGHSNHCSHCCSINQEIVLSNGQLLYFKAKVRSWTYYSVCGFKRCNIFRISYELNTICMGKLKYCEVMLTETRIVSDWRGFKPTSRIQCSNDCVLYLLCRLTYFLHAVSKKKEINSDIFYYRVVIAWNYWSTWINDYDYLSRRSVFFV